MNVGREVRTYEIAALRAEPVDGIVAGRVAGHAAVFGVEAIINGLFREVIRPGAFTDSIGRDDVRMLINHDPNLIVGRNRAGTLTLREDETGLAIEAMLPNTSYGRDLAVSVKRGDITQMSFAFSVEDGGESWNRSADALPLRVVTQARLWDVSAVTYPAFTTTDLALRAANMTAAIPKRAIYPRRHLLAVRRKT